MLLLCCAALGQTARVVLRWKAAPGVTGYQLQIARDTGFSQIVLDEKVQDPVLKWESLPSTLFYWRVRSFDAEGRASEWSAPRQIAPATGPPALRVPAEGAAVTCSPEPVAFSIEPSAVLKDYVLELASDDRFAPSETKTLKSTSGEFQAVLAPGAVSWRVRGVDLTGRPTEPSATRKLLIRLAPPKPRASPDVLWGTPTVTLSWAAAPCASRYVVEASHETPERTLLEAQETSMSFRPSGVGEYRFRVAARDARGNQSEWSAESSFRVRMPPPIARAETIGKVLPTGREVDLAWSAAPGAISYLVEVGATEGFKSPSSSVVSTLSHRLAVTPGRHVWRVTAKDAAGHLSFPSEPRSFLVPDPVAPSAVALQFPADGAVLLRPADGLIGVTWFRGDGDLTYELEIDGVVRPVGAPPARIELTEGDHVLRVRALGSSGKSSGWSQQVRFFFGSPRVVSASVSFDNEPLPADGASKSRVEIRLRDPEGRIVRGPRPELAVDRGQLQAVHREGELWVAEWQAPAELPADSTATLKVTGERFKQDYPLRLAREIAALSLAATVGGRFNFAAVTSPSATVSLAYRAPQLASHPTAHLRAGIYGASVRVTGPDGPVAVQVTAPSLTFLVGAHFDFGRWSLLGIVGGGLQVASSTVGGASQTTAMPAFEVAAALGRRLGPGAVEVELSFLYSRLNLPLAGLQAGGLFVGIGYRFDLPGGK